MSAFLRTLGATAIRLDGVSIPLSSREGALLAYLSHKKGIPASRTEIVELFWPTQDNQSARHSLSQLVYRLRRRTRDDLITSCDDMITADTVIADFVELLRSDDQSKILGLYAGRFLTKDDLYSAPLREWRDEIEGDIAVAVAGALQAQAHAAGAPSLPTVITVAARLLDLHPHLVEAQIAIVEALIRTGDHRQAKRRHEHFTECEVVGPVPLPPFESFLERPIQRTLPSQIGFVGRDGEVDKLEECWKSVVSGTGAFAVISGEPGIGKTRLADHVLRRAAIRGGATWIVRCCAATQRLPYSAVGELVRDNVSDNPDAIRSMALLSLRSPDSNPPVGTDEYRHQLTESLTSLVIDRCRDQPLIILIDDAQWADNYTAMLLAYWSYRLKSHRVLVILTVRTEEAEAPPDWISSDLGRVTTLQLGRISIEAASRIVEAYESSCGVALERDLRNAVLWHSAGRPFLLLEALRLAMSSDGATPPTANAILSATAESVLARRFRGLSIESAAALGALAVWGQEIRSDSLANIAGLTDDALVAGLDLLHRRGIAHWHAGNVSFPHDLMREAAYRSLLPATRAHFHSRAADELRRASGPNGLIAQHYANGGDSPNAAVYAEKASCEAWAAHLYTDYEFYSGMCIEHGNQDDKCRAAETFGRYLVQVGRSQEVEGIRHLLGAGTGDLLRKVSVFEQQLAAGTAQAMELLEYSRGIVELASDRNEFSAAPIIATLLDVALDAGSYEFGQQVAQTLLMNTDNRHSREATMIVRSIMAVWNGMTKGTAEAVIEAVHALEGVGSSTSPPAAALCMASYGTLLLLEGKIPIARKYFSSALDIAAAAGDHRRQWAILNNNGIALMEAGDHVAARQSWGRVVTAPNVHCRIRGYGNLAISHYEDTDMLNAGSAAEAVLSMNETYKSPAMASLAHGVLGLVALHSNNEKLAEEHSRSANAGLPQGLYTQTECGYACALHVRLLAQRGYTRDAVKAIDEAVAAIRPRDNLNGMRLLCEKADLLSQSNPDAAYAVAKYVFGECHDLGATLIYNRADRIMRSLIHV